MRTTVWAIAMSAALALPVAGATARVHVGTVKSADGVSIRYDSTGSGEPALVFIHCWTCHRGFWDAQVAHFAPRYRVVRLDLAGHGDSGGGRNDYTIAAFAEDVVAVIDALGLKQVVLIGHSMGGPVALQAEKTLGARVLGVVGVDCFYLGFQSSARDGEPLRLARDQTTVPEFDGGERKPARTLYAPGTAAGLIDDIARSMAATDRAIALSALHGTYVWYRTDATAALQRVGARLRNINGDPWGDREPLHPSVALIRGAAHFPAQEKPEEFNRVLEKIVQEFVGSSIRNLD